MQLSSRTMTPIVLAGLILVATLLIMLIEKVLEATNLLKPDPESTWTIATSMLLLFAVFVSVMLLRTTTSARSYWNQSMIGFMALSIANAVLARAMCGKWMAEVGSFKFLYLVVTIGFLVFISIVNMARKIVNFAEKEEWNEPRLKNRKRR